MNTITSEEIKEAVEWLMKEKEGCVHFKTGYYDDDDNPLCIVIGWSGGFDNDNSDKYSDGEYRICSKIAFNNSSLQCDYEFDFTMPYDENTDEVDDTDGYIGEDFDYAAKCLNSEVKRIAKEWCE